MVGRGYLDTHFENPHKESLNIKHPYDIFEHMYTEDFIGLDIDPFVIEFINQMVEVDMNYVAEFVKRSGVSVFWHTYLDSDVMNYVKALL